MNPNSENLLKTDQPISPPSIEKKVTPHEFLILGEIAQPEVKPTEPKLLLGDVSISEKQQ
jgi:hypothetical protein